MSKLKQEPKEAMKRALKNYLVDKKHLDRYAEMLVMRAVKFYIEGNLDAFVVEEDLLVEDKELPNLRYSEESLNRWIRGED